MKNYLILLLAAFAFSCSSDDAGKPASEKIIGTWQFVSGTIGNNALPLEECETSNKIIFTETKIFDELHYVATGTNSCALADDSFIGEWSNNGEDFTILSNPTKSFAFLSEAESITTQFSNGDATMNLFVNMSGENSASGEPYVINLVFQRVVDTPVIEF